MFGRRAMVVNRRALDATAAAPRALKATAAVPRVVVVAAAVPRVVVVAAAVPRDVASPTGKAESRVSLLRRNVADISRTEIRYAKRCFREFKIDHQKPGVGAHMKKMPALFREIISEMQGLHAEIVEEFRDDGGYKPMNETKTNQRTNE